jgi:phi13 family phage major tail protein
MAKTTCKYLTYAKYASGGDGSAVTYTGGKSKLDYLCKVDIGENRSNVKEYADGHQIDSENALNEVTLALELAATDADLKKDLLGQTESSSVFTVTGDDAPFVGVGFVLAERFKGTTTYEGYWFFKAQFTSGGLTSNTRKEQTQFDHETLNGSCMGVVQSSGGSVEYYTHKDGMTESAALAWGKGLAGISG